MLITGNGKSQTATRPEMQIQQKWIQSRKKRLTWHEAARFGMFIHYGIDTIAKMYYYDGSNDPWEGHPIPSEEYDRYWIEFTMKDFNAEQWAKTCADAGMKYLCFVAKHHSGFCMWNSKYTNYDITTITHRDVVGELAEACKKYDVKLCLYYSVADWYHPHSTYMNGGPGYELPPGVEHNFEQYVLYMKAQLKELATNYGKIHMIWFDGAWEENWNRDRAIDLYNYTMTLQSGIICNDRVGKHSYKLTNNLGDFYTPENFIGNYDRKNQWESAIKLDTSWHRVQGEKIKSKKRILDILCTCAGSDGNLLMNVGPHVKGPIVTEQVERLKEVGDWLKKNGKAIYGTRGGPYLPSKEMVSTCSGKQVYLHLLRKPAKDTLMFPALDAKLLSASLMNGKRLESKSSEDIYTIRIPKNLLDPDVTVIKLDINRTAFNLKEVAAGKVLRHNMITKPVNNPNVEEQ